MAADIPLSASDEELAKAAGEGDRCAFVELAERYRRVAFACAFALLGTREDAEDAVQEAIVRAYGFLAEGHVPRCWGAWFMSILRNYCRDVHRRRVVRDAAPELSVPLCISPEQEALRNEEARTLRHAVQTLPELLRVPVVLHYGYGLTYHEIAVALGIRPSTVTGRIAGALRRLRRSLSDGELL